MCRAKASLLRHCLEHTPVRNVATLPEPLRKIVETPPPSSSWVTDVSYHAICLAIADENDWDEVQFGRYWYEVMDEITKNPIYRFFFGFLTPQRIIKTASDRWGAFHVGTTMRSLSDGDSSISIRLVHPPNLINGVLARGYAQVIQRFAELSRQNRCDTQILKRSDVTLELRIELAGPISSTAS